MYVLYTLINLNSNSPFVPYVVSTSKIPQSKPAATSSVKDVLKSGLRLGHENVPTAIAHLGRVMS